MLSPQQYATPAAVTPHVWAIPAATAATGTGVSLVSVPLPSRPPIPQQYAAPSGVSAHVCWPPGLTVTNLIPAGSATSTGIALAINVPSPSCPETLLPQQ